MVFFYQPSSIEHEKREWLDHFEEIIAQASLKWNDITIFAGDFNIDLIDGDKITVNKYNDILDAYGLTQQISYPTRYGKSHISTNIPKKVICENVIPCETVSDHDAPFVVLNIKKQKFQPRYKFVRDLKDFSQLPLSTVYSFDDQDDQVETLNKLITDCLSHHAPIKRTKFTRPPAPWMKRLDIVNLQKKRNELRTTAHRTQTESDWELFRNTRNELKYKIKIVKRTFYKKALASKNSKTIWRTIYRILKPNPERCTASPTSLNNYYGSLAANLTGFTSNSESNVRSNTNENRDTFTLKPTTYDAVKKEINNLKSDCSTGFDTISAKYLKPASEYIASSITNIINNCITTNSFPKMWKIARISPVPKIKAPAKPSRL